MRKDLVSCGFIDLVVERQEGGRVPAHDVVISAVAFCDRGAGGVTRVEVPVDDGLSTYTSDLEYLVIVFAVRGTHERRDNARNFLQCLFDPPEFIVLLIPSEGG